MSLRKATTYAKTTVMFPTEVMRKIRRDLADHDMSSHAQSRLVVNFVKHVYENLDERAREEIIERTREEMGRQRVIADEEIPNGTIDDNKRYQENTDEFGLIEMESEQKVRKDLVPSDSNRQNGQKRELQIPSLH